MTATNDITLDASGISSEPVSADPSTEAPPRRSWLRNLMWGWFALSCLLFFTFLKLPEVRLRNFVQGQIASQLASQGIAFSVSQSSFSMLFGLNYDMRGVTLSPPPPSPEIKIDRLEVSPSILSLLTGKLGGSLDLHQGDGRMQGGFKMSPRGGELEVALELEKLNLGKLGVLPMLAGIQGGLQADGNVRLQGDPNVPNTLSGEIRLKPSKIVIEPQSVQGFSIPRLTVGSGDIDVRVAGGKLQLKTAALGKPGGADDVVATFTGDISLGRTPQASQMNVRARFSVSQNVKNAIPLLDALLSSAGGRQPDGSYAFQITGPVDSPIASPVSP
jgi:type II secretion system protein N